MKKLTYAIALSSLLLAGCSQDEGIMHDKGELVTLNYNVSIGNGAQSRTEGEVTPSLMVNKLMYAVYQVELDENNIITQSEWKYTDVAYDNNVEDGIQFRFSPNILKEYNYKIVFFACREEDDETCFTFDENMTLSSIQANDQKYGIGNFSEDAKKDAFVGSDIIKNGISTDDSPTLVRPFSQVNVLTSKTDYEAAEQLNQTPTECTITFSKLYDTYNAFSNTWSNKVENKALTSTIITEKKEKNDGNVVYYFLANEYLFAGADEVITCNVTIKSGQETIYDSGEISGFPLGSNQATNFLNKNLLTGGGVTYTIDVNNEFKETNYDINANN